MPTNSSKQFKHVTKAASKVYLYKVYLTKFLTMFRNAQAARKEQKEEKAKKMTIKEKFYDLSQKEVCSKRRLDGLGQCG